ncbi:MAG: TonB-dependent receptor [Flavisolibacter sp.]|nr:TonB-dependent receptor [Flavisolibacter sp.]
MRKIIALLLAVCIRFSADAQTTTGKITGFVKDDKGAGIPSATVSLLTASNAALVKVAITDKAGLYEFLNIREGKYKLSASSVGFKKDSSAVFELAAGKTVEVPQITLAAGTTDLANVTVEAKRPFIETKLDKTIVNVEASPGNAGSTALEVLEKSPGVLVNSDGVISLRGKQGVIVMMDGKPTYLSAADLANMLKNMPASALDQIEIMTNPSSKYDASGNSGIINIKTKKGKNDGFNGSVTLGATTSIYKPEETLYFMPKSQNSFNFNYRKNKINVFGNYNPNLFRGRNTLTIDRKFPDGSTSDVDTRFRFGNNNHTLKLGLDWYANKKNVFGVVVNGFQFMGHPRPRSTTYIRDANGQVLSTLVSNTDNDISFENFTGNLNWKHTFDTAGKELTADLDYVTYDNVSDMLLTTDSYFGGQQASLFLRGHLPSNINIYSFKSDYVQPFKGGRFEAGVKTSVVRNDNLVDYKRLMNDQWVPDARSNHFLYDENINAAYVNVNRQFKKWTLQGGLRVENAVAEGDQVTSKESFRRDTTNLFPSAFVSYEVDKKNKLTVSYSKRINRPNYQNLNPFIYFLDSLSYQQGNPNLRPQYTHNFELSHAFKGKFITTLAYNRTRDVMAQILKQNTAEKKTFLTFDNVARQTNYSLSVTVPLTLAKWWNANFFSTVYRNRYTGIYNTKPIDIKATSFMANMTNTFTLTKTLTMELGGFYRYRSLFDLTIMEPIYQMNIAAQKQVLKGKGTVRLNVRDPFAWQHFEGLTRYEDIDTRFNARPDIRQVTATFTYRFGKNTPQAPRRRNTGGSQEEQNRVGGGGGQQ